MPIGIGLGFGLEFGLGVHLEESNLNVWVRFRLKGRIKLMVMARLTPKSNTA